MVGLGFNPRVGHLGTWDFSQGRSQRNRTLAKSKDYPGTPLPISQRWLECVDDELSALAVKTLSLCAFFCPAYRRSPVLTIPMIHIHGHDVTKYQIFGIMISCNCFGGMFEGVGVVG